MEDRMAQTSACAADFRPSIVLNRQLWGVCFRLNG